MIRIKLSDKIMREKDVLIIKTLLILFQIIILTGCITLQDPEASQIYRDDTIGVATSTQTIGQSITSHRPRLNGIYLWLSSDGSDNTLIIKLLPSPNDKISFEITSIPFRKISSNGSTYISFSPQSKHPSQSYYIKLKTTGGEVRVFGRHEDSYPYGSAYNESLITSGDIAFRLSYLYEGSAILSDIKDAISISWVLFPLTFILFLPGWLLLEYSGISKRFKFDELIALSIGLSIVIIPISILWTSTLGLRWNREIVIIGSFVITFLFFRRFWVDRETYLGYFKKKYPIQFDGQKEQSSGGDEFDTINHVKEETNLIRQIHPVILLLIIFIIVFGVRMAMVRDLAAPAWVDSVHHALITRLILENGSLPTTYLPYLPDDVRYYHPGFHSLVAVFQWLSGLDLIDALLILGQVLNALSIFSVYLFTNTLFNNRSAGLFAAVITGFMTPMPAYYASWGRYTQLAGLIVLPLGLSFVKNYLAECNIDDSKKFNLRSIFLGSLIFAGSVLLHYRVAVFLGLLVAAFMISHIRWRKFPDPETPQPKRVLSSKFFYKKQGVYWLSPKSILLMIVIFIGAFLIILPWVLPTITQVVIPMSQEWENRSTELFSDFSWRFLTPALGTQSLILAAIGLLWGGIQRKRQVFTIVLWIILMFLFANLGSINIPNPGFINNTSVLITLFMPISALGGFLFSQLISLWNRNVPHRIAQVLDYLFLIMGIFIIILGTRELLPLLNPDTFLFRERDKSAIEWINKNLPKNETVLINSTAWGYGVYMGSDGGYWISPLTGLKTLPPPVLYGLADPSYVRSINEVAQIVSSTTTDDKRIWELAHQHGIRYIYLGARGGALSQEMLNTSPLFEKIFTHNSTWIYEVKKSE